MFERLRNGIFLAFMGLAILLAASCKKEGACISASGASVEKIFDLPLINSVDLRFVATLYIRQDTTLKESTLRLIAQKNVHERIDVTHANGKLSLAFTDCIKSHNPIEAYLAVKSLEQIAVNSAGDIIGENVITGDEISLSIGGLGDINLLMDAGVVKSKVQGSGNILIAGRCVRHEVEMQGSGDINSLELVADTVTVTMNSNGAVNVHALDRLEVDFNVPGKVGYRGKPTVLAVGANGEVVDVNL